MVVLTMALNQRLKGCAISPTRIKKEKEGRWTSLLLLSFLTHCHSAAPSKEGSPACCYKPRLFVTKTFFFFFFSFLVFSFLRLFFEYTSPFFVPFLPVLFFFSFLCLESGPIAEKRCISCLHLSICQSHFLSLSLCSSLSHYA